MKTVKPLPPRSLAAFTLIELLVVIAIIALLAAILFPVFSSAREKARQTSCLNNEKQLGAAFLQYEQDYDEQTPCDYNGNFDGWLTEIYPYVKSKQVFVCPDDTSYTGETFATGQYPNCQQTAGNNGGNGNKVGDVDSYAMNSNVMQSALGGNVNVTKANKYATLASQASPSLTVEIFEVRGGTQVNIGAAAADNSEAGNGSGEHAPNVNYYENRPSSPYGCAVYETGDIGAVDATDQPDMTAIPGTHSGGANYLACDGHVKWLMPSQVSGGQVPDTTWYDWCCTTGNPPAKDPVVQQNETISGPKFGYATDTTTMQLSTGAPVAMTFSPK